MLWLVLSRSALCSTCIFLLERSWQIQNLQPKQRKKKCEYCHSWQWNYHKKLRRLNFFRHFKDGWRRQTFSKWVLLSWRSGNCWCRNWNRHHRVPYNKHLLTELARAVLGNISPRSWQYRPSEARSVRPRPRAKRELTQRRRQRQRQRKRHLKINIWEMVTIWLFLHLPRIPYFWQSTREMDW